MLFHSFRLLFPEYHFRCKQSNCICHSPKHFIDHRLDIEFNCLSLSPSLYITEMSLVLRIEISPTSSSLAGRNFSSLPSFTFLLLRLCVHFVATEAQLRWPLLLQHERIKYTALFVGLISTKQSCQENLNRDYRFVTFRKFDCIKKLLHTVSQSSPFP